jgi:hypothetical protein
LGDGATFKKNGGPSSKNILRQRCKSVLIASIHVLIVVCQELLNNKINFFKSADEITTGMPNRMPSKL